MTYKAVVNGSGEEEGPEFQKHIIAIHKQANILSCREYKRFSGCSTDFNYSQVSINNPNGSFRTPSLYYWNHSHHIFLYFFFCLQITTFTRALLPVINPLNFD